MNEEVSEVYKVVWVSFDGLKYTYHSAVVRLVRACAEYLVGERVYPKIGQFLAFDSLEYALPFWRDIRAAWKIYNPTVEVWLCRAGGVYPVPKVAKHWQHISHISRFWMGYQTFCPRQGLYVPTIPTPPGTVGCDWIELVKRVHPRPPLAHTREFWERPLDKTHPFMV